jgi:polyhydroxyalkanoate synthase
LIQYSPATAAVFAEPILIIPAWIMKYYILDLSAKQLLGEIPGLAGSHGVHGVVEESDRERPRARHGRLLEAWHPGRVDAVSRIVPDRKIHSVGYCIGGTCCRFAAAVSAADGDQRLASMTLLAAQQDFSEPGELSFSSVRASSTCWRRS